MGKEGWAMLAVVALAANAASAAETAGRYAQDLGRVYGAYQRMLAMKEACDAAVPASRDANDQAFAAWLERHRALVRELQQRVTALIRLASRDQNEYVRNLGKYEGAILQERQEYREALLTLGAAELREQCSRMPERLKTPEADLAHVYAAELEVIRRRK
jgi:hypothetical protein